MRLLAVSWVNTGKNRYLTPENFSKELVLRFNLEPLHLLNDLIDEVLALGTTKSKDLKKSATIGSFQKKMKPNLVSHSLFGFPARPNKEKKTVIYD